MMTERSDPFSMVLNKGIMRTFQRIFSIKRSNEARSLPFGCGLSRFFKQFLLLATFGHQINVKKSQLGH